MDRGALKLLLARECSALLRFSGETVAPVASGTPRIPGPGGTGRAAASATLASRRSRGTGRSVGLSDLHDAAVIVRHRTVPGDTRHASRGTTHTAYAALLPPAARGHVRRPSHRRAPSDPGEKRRPPTTPARDNKCVSDPADGYMPGEVRYEYRRKHVLREKMTPRRRVLAGIRRAIFAAGVLALVVLVLSGQDGTNTLQHGNSLEDANLTPEEKILEQITTAETEQRLTTRRKFLAEKCAEEGLDRPGNDSLHRPNAWEFLVNREYHLIWCNVFKAASTSWMYNFNLLAGYSPQFLKASKAVPVSLARQRYPRHSAEELAKYLNDSISFLIVRHPFERLLSAYRDKLEHSLPHTFHSNLGAHIVWHYRARDSKTTTRQGPRYPLFEEFVRWLLCQWRAGNELDMHWTPVVNFCTPCQVRFDVIAKFETLHDDQDYLIKQARVGHIIKPEWKNPTKGVQTKDVIKNYFTQLSKTQIEELYEMFRYDFVLFDYSPEEYLAFGRDEITTLTCKK